MLDKLIPWPWKIIAAAALAVALLATGWVKGAAHVQDQWNTERTAQTLQVSQVRTRQAEATVKVVTEYVDRVRIVREKGAEIIKEVPVYVSVQDDHACVIGIGFVRLHDAAARGELPGPARDTDAAPAGVALSTVGATVADNYGRCHETREQLIALQAWIVEMNKAAEDGGLQDEK